MRPIDLMWPVFVVPVLLMVAAVAMPTVQLILLGRARRRAGTPPSVLTWAATQGWTVKDGESPEAEPERAAVARAAAVPPLGYGAAMMRRTDHGRLIVFELWNERSPDAAFVLGILETPAGDQVRRAAGGLTPDTIEALARELVAAVPARRL